MKTFIAAAVFTLSLSAFAQSQVGIISGYAFSAAGITSALVGIFDCVRNPTDPKMADYCDGGAGRQLTLTSFSAWMTLLSASETEKEEFKIIKQDAYQFIAGFEQSESFTELLKQIRKTYPEYENVSDEEIAAEIISHK